ncbi:hypothetical protein AB6N24_16195 [Cellulomonas sp. 179-A 4D5 NHS]
MGTLLVVENVSLDGVDLAVEGATVSPKGAVTATYRVLRDVPARA